MSEKFEFQTEVSKLLKLMIHSLYSNSDVFLRELISNASDACDKLRFQALNNDSLWEDNSELAIKITPNTENGTLTIEDNGIGMSRDELIENLGTIANSGTAQFLEQMTGDQQKDAHLIGQFGVGFYSSFIVAEKVEVHSRKAGSDNAIKWTSEGEGSYEIDDSDLTSRGTKIVLHLREDAKKYTESYTLHSLIKKYADHITLPVFLWQKPVEPVASEEDTTEENKEVTAAEADPYKQINDAKALWVRPKSEITDEEYQQFYQSISNDFQAPLKWSHNQIEGKLNYTSLLYIPQKAPFDLYNRDAVKGLKLYIQRVFIMDDAEQFLPMYLRFIKGVLDCADLPLNISRELLQENALTQKLRTALTGRVLKMLEKLAAKDAKKYLELWNEFGSVLKEGLVEDMSNQSKVAKLLRYKHANSDNLVSLDEYIASMKAAQEPIYFLTAESESIAKQSPHLEYFKKNEMDVLLLTDPVDEWVMSSFTEYEGKKFVDIARGDFAGDASTKDKDGDNNNDEETSAVISQVTTQLKSSVSEVRYSKRLVSSPACLVLGKDELGAQMRRILEASGQSMPESLPILELNEEHNLVKRLKTAEGDRFEQITEVLFGQAQLSDGKVLQNPERYAQALNALLAELPE